MLRVSAQETMVCHNFISTQHNRSTPGSHNTGTEHAWWHCQEAMAGSAAGEQSHCWDNGVVCEQTQSTSTTESSSMRLPEESACIFF